MSIKEAERRAAEVREQREESEHRKRVTEWERDSKALRRRSSAGRKKAQGSVPDRSG
jgi:hypothetical protein